MRQPLLFVRVALAVTAVALASCSTAPTFDIVIVGGSVIDGTGASARRADVGINGDRIAAVGNLIDRTASQRIDANGMIVAPGFIDVMGRSGVSLLANGLAETHLRQGITTELLVDRSPAFWTQAAADQDALRVAGVTFDWRGFDGYFRKLASRGIAINIGSVAPVSLATSDVETFVDEAMRDGAWGVVDDSAMNIDGLRRVAAAAGESNGVLMIPASNPVLASDDLFFSVADIAHRVVVTDLGELRTAANIATLNGRITRATQRGLSAAVYGTLIPSPEMPGGTWVQEALHYGGVMLATNTEATTVRRVDSPAAAGVFPWLLGQMVRNEHVMELKEAVRRSTSLPAAAFNIPQRGILREDYFADVVVFDPSTIADRSTAEGPTRYPAGVEYVLVNGVVTSTPRGPTGARPGYGLVRRRAAQ